MSPIGPIPSDIAAQENVGVQGNSGCADEGPNPTFLTQQRHGQCTAALGLGLVFAPIEVLL